MAEVKCPICGKSGIPDYHSQDTVCPCCGSDLSIYRLVDTIKDSSSVQKGGRNRLLIPTGIATAAALVLGISCICINNSRKAADEKVETLTAQISTLNTEVADLQSSLDEARKVSTGHAEGSFTYTVRKGDSFWTISRRIYGNGAQYTKIAAANNLETNARLHVGDKLIIPGIE